jgi:hypothetical protein
MFEQTIVMGDRKRIGSLFFLHTNHARNRTAIRTQIRTRVDGPLRTNGQLIFVFSWMGDPSSSAVCMYVTGCCCVSRTCAGYVRPSMEMEALDVHVRYIPICFCNNAYYEEEQDHVTSFKPSLGTLDPGLKMREHLCFHYCNFFIVL